MASNCCCRAVTDCAGATLTAISGLLLSVCLVVSGRAEDPAPSFFRGLNLNGPPVFIDGNQWEGRDSKHYVCNDKAFENQAVPLVPSTDQERARMLRSSRWGGNRIELTGLPNGTITVFLYAWEDNAPETYSVSINGREVLRRHNSGKAGHWDKLGPWFVEVANSRIDLTSQGGAANFSGIEIWRGRHEGGEPPITPDDLVFFENRIRPLLVKHCYECHSAEAKDLQGELLLDSKPAARRGGATGAAVVPGDLEHSLLITAVRYKNDAMQMPPDGKLSDAEIADLERWIKIGAPDPRVKATKFAGKQIDVATARQFWSLKPLSDPAVPEVKNTTWPISDIDRFVLAKLEVYGLKPAAEADKRTLIRRATYDLTGLPPTVDEVDAFIADGSPQAFETVVNRLLASPRYGERWGRHWLDVVRYADTAGDNSDYPIPQMHRYRDWVIAGFNRDLPYDEFVRDQLAGDLRGGKTDDERYERIIATGYIANARRFGSRVDDYPQHLTIEDTLDNVGRCFLGLTLSCARCHDHKFDPITTRDYYGLYGIFHSTRYPWPGIELEKRQRDFVPLVPPGELAHFQKIFESRKQQQARLDAEVNRLKDARKKAPENLKKELADQLKQAEKVAAELRETPPPFETVYAVAEASTTEDVPVQLKGDPTRPGDLVPRHFLSVLGGAELPSNSHSSGRAQLAEWILAADNPLPARVMVNRIWQHHFGRGLVPTPNDFGKQGKPPVHPELLDHLATAFRHGGWSIKAMHRRIMLSQTYQQSANRAAEAVAKDPANDWLAGQPRRRLDAESIRDTLLMLGGNLDLSPAGPHPFPPEHTWNFTQHHAFKAVYDSRHRSVYLMTQRIQRHPYLAIFDGADPSTSTPARTTSTTPLQALYLLNNPFVHEQSKLVASRIMAHSTEDIQRLQYASELLFSRPAVDEELSTATNFLAKARSLLQSPGTPADQIETEVWQAYIRSLFRLNEFVYLD